VKHVRDFHSQTWANPFYGPRQPGVWSSLLWLAGSLVILGGLAYVFIYSPLFRISQVTVNGATTVDPVRVRVAAMGMMSGYEYLVIPKDHILAADAVGIRNLIMAQFSGLLDVRSEKKFRTLAITVIERQPTYRLIIGDKSFLLDQDGVGLREAGAGEGQALLALQNDSAQFVAGKAMIHAEWIKALSDLHKYFATQVGLRDQLFRLDDTNGVIQAVTAEGWYIIVDPATDVNVQLKILSSALLGKFNFSDRKKLSYIDVRFGDKIFYKWK
jgi:cell division septal protein FtsQ